MRGKHGIGLYDASDALTREKEEAALRMQQGYVTSNLSLSSRRHDSRSIRSSTSRSTSRSASSLCLYKCVKINASLS